jgi:hypothetical protein
VLDGLVGGGGDASVATAEAEAHAGGVLGVDEVLDLLDHVGEGGALVVLEVHQQVDGLAAVGVEAEVRVGGAAAGAQGGFRALQGGPAGIGFVVAGHVELGQAGHGGYGLHAHHAAHVQVEALHGVHHLPVQAGFGVPFGFHVHRQHVHPDRIVADDSRVVLVVAGLGPQFGHAGAHVTGLQLA